MTAACGSVGHGKRKELAELRAARAIGHTPIGRVPGTSCRTAVVNARAALIRVV
jgi:hypothetical protein